MKKENFFSPSKGFISFEQTIKEIINYMQEPGSYKIIVGCDSSSSDRPHFPVAIVVLREGRGGIFFLKRIKYASRTFYSTKERIMEEVYLSCKIAVELREKLSFSEVFHIHADVGENGRTKDMIREVTSFIRGNGFEPKIKPESFVASTLADRYT